MMRHVGVGLVVLASLAGCGSLGDNQSSGIVVNVAQSGPVWPTWDVYLLHGTGQVSEARSEIFSLPKGADSLLDQARAFEANGLRVTVHYTHYRGLSCVVQKLMNVNDCDVVSAFTTAAQRQPPVP